MLRADSSAHFRNSKRSIHRSQTCRNVTCPAQESPERTGEKSSSRQQVTRKTNYRCYRLSPAEVSFTSSMWEADWLRQAKVSLQIALQYLFPQLKEAIILPPCNSCKAYIIANTLRVFANGKYRKGERSFVLKLYSFRKEGCPRCALRHQHRDIKHETGRGSSNPAPGSPCIQTSLKEPPTERLSSCVPSSPTYGYLLETSTATIHKNKQLCSGLPASFIIESKPQLSFQGKLSLSKLF